MEGILIDFGSTYTKVIIVDLKEPRIVARSRAVSTVGTNVMIGLGRALSQLDLTFDSLRGGRFDHKYACSSAAGGLKMVVIGLVPELTALAGKRAALGAGAKVMETYSYELTAGEVERIESHCPDIVLLVGGTDGGDRKTVIRNANMLAKSRLDIPIVVAGNKEASAAVKQILDSCGKHSVVTDNVMPELGELHIEPTKEIIRNVFMERIVHAKGLGEARELVEILMPTPAATLMAAKLLADGTDEEKGLGEILVVEMGGATTNVYSITAGRPTQSKVIWKGLREPYAKRTVEGDLGVRVSAVSLVEAAGKRLINEELREELGNNVQIEIEKEAVRLSTDIGIIPKRPEEFAFDTSLARAGVKIAVERHVGSIKEVFSPMGHFFLQTGKDLTNVKYVIGTGGPIVYGNVGHILEEALFDENEPFLLKPRNPELLVDRDYVFWAMGLLSNASPGEAIQIMKRSLQPVQVSTTAS
jgi:uncharacterized protein (TIGR01319 family)